MKRTTTPWTCREDVWLCSKCRTPHEWFECESCGGEGMDGHDCGEDVCCCLDPEPNVPCHDCGGSGKVHACPRCAAGGGGR